MPPSPHIPFQSCFLPQLSGFQLEEILTPLPHLASRGHLTVSEVIFGCHPWERECTDQAKDAAEHPTMQGTAPHNQDESGPNVTTADTRCLVLRVSPPSSSPSAAMSPNCMSRSRAIGIRMWPFTGPSDFNLLSLSYLEHAQPLCALPPHLWRPLMTIKWDKVGAALSLSPPSSFRKQHWPPSCPAWARRRLFLLTVNETKRVWTAGSHYTNQNARSPSARNAQQSVWGSLSSICVLYIKIKALA